MAIKILKSSDFYLIFYLESLTNAQITSTINAAASKIDAIYVLTILYNDMTINDIEISICINGEYKTWLVSFRMIIAITIAIINIMIA